MAQEEEKQDDAVVLLAADQRQPMDDEPCCAVCSRYGAYICDATDEDVCSIECRDVCIMRHREARALSEEQVRQRALAAKLLRRRLEIRVTSGSAAAADDDGDNAHNSNSSMQTIIPFPIVDFADCDLPPQLYANMQKKLFEKPSPVQMQVLPCVLARHSLLVVAPTGTGKTAAYLIPVIAQLINARLSSHHYDETADDLSSHRSSAVAVILAPIRELAIQIEEVAKLLAQGVPNMKTALLVGGFPVPPQLHRLQSGVQVVVATPGRFIDVFTNYDLGVSNSSDTDQGRQQGTSLASVVCCVVDEVDMMLAIGFHAQISQIIGLLPPLAQLQLLFFSATISTQVEALVKRILLGTKTPLSDQQQQLSNYFRIEVGWKKQRQGDDANLSSSSTTCTANPNIRQKIIWAEDKAKKKLLFDFLKSKQNEATLVFVKSKIGANLLADAVEKQTQIPSASIHADKSQKDRLLALEAFVNREVRVLVSTNVLSRGMDLLQVQNVVVFDFPNKVSDYIHLIGRTGRGNDASGNALVMVNKDDKVVFRELVGALRGAKVGAVPREIYQSLYADAQKEAFKSSALVIDEAKRAFRVQDELGGELGQPHESWRQWSEQAQKKQRQA